MPKPDRYSPSPAPSPVTPPTLPPDFPEIEQNPSSELQPPPPLSATPDMVAGTTDFAEADTQESSEASGPHARADEVTQYSSMRSWITRPFRRAACLRWDDLGGKPGRPMIVTEQQADAVELLYHAFRRLDVGFQEVVHSV